MIEKKAKGLLIINTGNGKGKTTAALGMMLRAWGHGMRFCMLQFLKSGEADYGEYLAAKKLGWEIHPLGDGCTWNSKDMEATKAVNLKAWQTAQATILSNQFDMIVLDEFTHVLKFGRLDAQQVVDWISSNKPKNLHLVITGRDAPEVLINAADLVTEMNEIKHPYTTLGLSAQKGVEK